MRFPLPAISPLPLPALLAILAALAPGPAAAQSAAGVSGGRAPRPALRLVPPPPVFGPPSDYELAGEVVADTAVADFDGDGWLDLAVSSQGGEISILYGDGTGSLADGENFWAIQNVFDPGPGGIGAGDFDGNGVPDLAVTVAGSYDGLGQPNYKTHVYLTGPDRNWTYSTTVLTHATFPYDAASGDFDEDGRLDLVVVSTSGFDVFLGHGDGTFDPGLALVGTNPPTGFEVQTADVDRDGHLDIVAGFGSTFPGTRVYWGDGSGVFSASASTFTGPGYHFALGDVNRDGYLDTIVSVISKFPNYTGALWVTYGGPQQTMTFGAKYGPAFVNPGRVVAADLNHDSLVDVLASEGGQHRLFLGQYDGSLLELPKLNIGVSSAGGATAGDWSADGRVDLAFLWEIVGQTPQARVLLNQTP